MTGSFGPSGSSLDPSILAAAVAVLRRGGLLGLPTETVYGLAADATDPRAVAAIYAAKQRPRFNPLIAHVADRASAEREGLFGPAAHRLAEAFWPGPLTLVVPMAPGGTVCDLARAGLASVGLRVPAPADTRAILAAFGRPVAAPSANRSGALSPTTAIDVRAELGSRVDLVVDGGPSLVGIESTIVACLGAGARLLRPGGIARADIETVLGHPLDHETLDLGGPLLSPGLLPSHYAPRALVRRDADQVGPGEALLTFGGRRLPGGAAAVTLDLSPSGDLVEAATNLFGMLRSLDASGASMIAVAPVPEHGLGEAINDRLKRAAAPR